MATLTLNSQVQSLVAEYSVFWQSWPQFEQIHGERRLVGVEVELIGFHTSDLNQLDPSFLPAAMSGPSCSRSRMLCLGRLAFAEITSRTTSTLTQTQFCRLPALGNRSAVSVSIYVFWNRSNGQSFETDLLSEIKAFLSAWGIHQR